MDTQAQQSPDATAPLPCEQAIPKRKVPYWVWSIVVTSVVLVLVGVLAQPMIIRAKPRSSQTQAIFNAYQIGQALSEFEKDYGSYPGIATMSDVKANTETTLPLGTKSSNDLLRQLLAGYYTENEMVFYAKIAGVHKPDGVTEGAEALRKGECGFSYIPGVPEARYPDRPVIVTPLIPGTDRFDPKPFDGTAIVLRADGNVHMLAIDKSSHVMDKGMNILDPENPIWGKEKPVVYYPE